MKQASKDYEVQHYYGKLFMDFYYKIISRKELLENTEPMPLFNFNYINYCSINEQEHNNETK